MTIEIRTGSLSVVTRSWPQLHTASRLRTHRSYETGYAAGTGVPRTHRALLRFGEHYRQIAKPFEWTFTRADLDRGRVYPAAPG